jgi:hypothetical protein
MRAEDAAKDIRRRILNRPNDDDLFDYPSDYFHALTVAVAWMKRKIAAQYPAMLYETFGVIAPDEGSARDPQVFTLPDDHLGEIEVWTPPGPPRGRLVYSTLPEEQAHEGAYMQGRQIIFPRKRFHPGIYVRWIPATHEIKERETDTNLPAYTDEAVKQYAAYIMARKPGSLLQAESYLAAANAEFDGDRNSISDEGILGRISRQVANQAMATAAYVPIRPWYRGIN